MKETGLVVFAVVTLMDKTINKLRRYTKDSETGLQNKLIQRRVKWKSI